MPPESNPVMIETAAPEDADAIAALVNRAYEVERFFVLGDRTTAEEVREAMTRGSVLVAREEGILTACIHVDLTGEPATFGMLAVDPGRQREGWGGRLIDAAEASARAAGRREMEILVVNLREDLLPRYRRRGYRERTTRPYEHRPTIRPCHFIVMRKRL